LPRSALFRLTYSSSWRDPKLLDLYLKVRDLIAGSDVSAATAFGLGRKLADATLLPNAKEPQILAERFEEHRLANAFGWLDDLDAKLPSRSAATVRATLSDWERWVARLPRTAEGVIDPAALTEAAIWSLRQQGDTWRRLLTGEQWPDQLLDSQAYVGAAINLLGAAWRVCQSCFPIRLIDLAARRCSLAGPSD
jgi:hypothetical protein